MAVAAATEGLTASIREISRQVSQSSKIATLAVADARRTDEMARVLMERTAKIRDAVGVITDITGQANLLAFGAAVGTACAGDAGKEFSAIASDVVDLLDQTEKAAEEIEAEIEWIQSTTKECVDAIRGIMATREGMGSI
ncbi:MAG: methyl-accepting chemotaxis protein [Acetobacteraceae bacterium]|nr:methyl-accepting chemotaxis protein [Acetobacteraceae bacterium]